MGYDSGNSGNRLLDAVVKIGPGCAQEGAFCQFLGEGICPKIYAVWPDGYCMEKLSIVLRTSHLLQQMEIVLEKTVWNRSSQYYDVTGQLDYIEYHASLGLEIPKWAIPSEFCLTHGDPTVSNALTKNNGQIILCDPRPPRAYVPSCKETDAARILQSLFGWEIAAYHESKIDYELPKFWYDKEFRNRALFWLIATTFRVENLELSRSSPRLDILRWCAETRFKCPTLYGF